LANKVNGLVLEEPPAIDINDTMRQGPVLSQALGEPLAQCFHTTKGLERVDKVTRSVVFKLGELDPPELQAVVRYLGSEIERRPNPEHFGMSYLHDRESVILTPTYDLTQPLVRLHLETTLRMAVKIEDLQTKQQQQADQLQQQAEKLQQQDAQLQHQAARQQRQDAELRALREQLERLTSTAPVTPAPVPAASPAAGTIHVPAERATAAPVAVDPEPFPLTYEALRSLQGRVTELALAATAAEGKKNKRNFKTNVKNRLESRAAKGQEEFQSLGKLGDGNYGDSLRTSMKTKYGIKQLKKNTTIYPRAAVEAVLREMTEEKTKRSRAQARAEKQEPEQEQTRQDVKDWKGRQVRQNQTEIYGGEGTECGGG
jgi:hypothetical protein